MREAALTIAALGDDFAPSLARRLAGAVRDLVRTLRRDAIAARDLAALRRLDRAGLDDVGLTPTDLAALDPSLDALAATRALAGAAEARRRDRGWRI